MEEWDVILKVFSIVILQNSINFVQTSVNIDNSSQISEESLEELRNYGSLDNFAEELLIFRKY